MYTFDPTKFGFEPIANFRELNAAQWYGSNTYIKVIANGNYGRKVYWYMAISLNDNAGERVRIYGHAYDELDGINKSFHKYNEPKLEYFGLISNDEFAKELLKHLFGTTYNKSVEKEGVERLNQNINDQVQ